MDQVVHGMRLSVIKGTEDPVPVPSEVKEAVEFEENGKGGVGSLVREVGSSPEAPDTVELTGTE